MAGLHKLFAQFFWSSSVGGTSRHWASWNTLCMPVEEGGIGFRSLHDVAKALFSKLWWNFRTKQSLWSSFDFGIDETIHNVHDVTLDGEWDVDRLFEMLPEDLAVYILEKINPPSPQQVLDMPCWMLETRGYFSVKLAWDYTRRRDEPRTAYRMIWATICHQNVGVVYNLTRNVSLVFRSETARTTWKYFLSRAGIAVEGLTLHQAIIKCWTANVCLRLKPVMQALPSCAVWELWKRRNSMKYGDVVTTSRVIYQVSSSLQALVIVRKPGMEMVPHKWQDLLAMMENFTPKLKVTKVMWELPSAGWLKVNTDGASRGNPGRSSIGFCIRNENGDIVKSVGKQIKETTNTVAEAKDMVEVEEMMQLMNGDNYTVTHIHREGNKLADHLANYALDHGEIKCQQFWHLDAQGRSWFASLFMAFLMEALFYMGFCQSRQAQQQSKAYKSLAMSR
uniref:RNase H type-1 domain-containing protein n=1 Tax=Nicotiana tabacum TaxID=4097 RepID=A0A1S3Z5A1_TOBAC|nr:PREDICTED: uncharacterized protein LOC107783113 [Nicotiana tabacum]